MSQPSYVNNKDKQRITDGCYELLERVWQETHLLPMTFSVEYSWKIFSNNVQCVGYNSRRGKHGKRESSMKSNSNKNVNMSLSIRPLRSLASGKAWRSSERLDVRGIRLFFYGGWKQWKMPEKRRKFLQLCFCNRHTSALFQQLVCQRIILCRSAYADERLSYYFALLWPL